MDEYWIDFSGYLKVKAESADEAEQKFWELVNQKFDLSHTEFSDDVWDIDHIEAVFES